MQQEQIAAQEKAKQMEIQAAAERDDKMIQKDITVAEIRAAGMGATSDINQNMISDYNDSLKAIRGEEQYQEQMNLKRESEINKTRIAESKLNLEKEKIQSQESIANKQLQIARENKNKYDVKGKSDKK
jgi:hypothetical protein